MNEANHLKELVETEDMRPDWNNRFVPECSDCCPSFDGKRCQLLGHRPDEVCRPAIAVICIKANHALSIGEQMPKTEQEKRERTVK